MQNASIPYISEKTSGYPSVVHAFEAVLDDSKKTVAVADSFSKVIKEIPDRHFYRYGYGSEFVSMLLQTFKRDPVEYPQIDVVKQPMHFLSGDQIDNFLISRGSGISDGKMRIYSFFCVKRIMWCAQNFCPMNTESEEVQMIATTTIMTVKGLLFPEDLILTANSVFF